MATIAGAPKSFKLGCGWKLLIRKMPHEKYCRRFTFFRFTIVSFCFHMVAFAASMKFVCFSLCSLVSIMSFWISKLFKCCLFLSVFMLCSDESCLTAFRFRVLIVFACVLLAEPLLMSSISHAFFHPTKRTHCGLGTCGLVAMTSA